MKKLISVLVLISLSFAFVSCEEGSEITPLNEEEAQMSIAADSVQFMNMETYKLTDPNEPEDGDIH